MGARPVDAFEEVAPVALPVRVHDLDRHDPHAGGDAGDADGVIGLGGDGPRDMGAVAITIGDVRRPGPGVVWADHRDGREVRVRALVARVEQCHDDGR